MTDTIEPPELAAVRPGEELDWDSLEPYMKEHVAELSGPMTVLQFPSGAANLTYLLRFGDTELVLRRPPFGVVAPGAHDMRREYKVLSRLWRNFDRAPRAYVFCDDKDVIGADFVVMERREGEVIRNVVPGSMAQHRDIGRRISFALVDAMADMHLLDPADNDLSDLGKPDGFAARQVAGWKTRWDLVRPEDGLPLMDEVPERLAASVPAATRVSIVHNDLKLDNCQFDPANPDRVKSIFDWDMTTLGEPLVDLGTLLNYWPDPSDPPDAAPGQPRGFVADEPADAGRDHVPLRRAHRHRRVVGGVVRGLRPVEDGRGHPAAAQPLEAGREHRSPDGRHRRPPPGPGRERLEAAHRPQSLSNSWARPQRRAMPLIQRCGSAALRSMNVCISGWVRIRNRSSLTASITRAAASIGRQHLAAADHGAGPAGVAAGTAAEASPCRRAPGQMHDTLMPWSA